MTTHRLHHLDNLRSAMVLCILVLHAMLAYNVFGTWWYAADPAKQPGFEAIGFLLDSFPLPVLFFLAGFFAVPSLQRRGLKAFALGKGRRLGIPLVLTSLLLLPLIPWITLSTRGIPTPGPLKFWATFAVDGLLPKWTLVQTIPDYAALGVQFSQYHLWFISLLLVFFAVSVPLLRLPRRARQDSPAKATLCIAAVCLGMLLLMTALGGVTHVWSWANLRWLLFQPVRLPLYFGFYLLGVMAWRRSWLESGSLPGPLWAWALAALVSTGAYFVITGSLMTLPYLLAPGQNLLLAVIRTGLSLAWLGLLLRIFGHWAAGAGPLLASLAASSYAIYLLHLPICVVAQWMLVPVSLAPVLKAALVLALSLVLPWTLHSAWRKDWS